MKNVPTKYKDFITDYIYSKYKVGLGLNTDIQTISDIYDTAKRRRKMTLNAEKYNDIELNPALSLYCEARKECFDFRLKGSNLIDLIKITVLEKKYLSHQQIKANL